MAGSEFLDAKLQPTGGIYDDPIDLGNACPARPFSEANGQFWSSVGLSPVIPPGLANSPFAEDECNTDLRWSGACEAFAEVRDKAGPSGKGGMIGSVMKKPFTLIRGAQHDLPRSPVSKGFTRRLPAKTEHHDEIFKLALKSDADQSLRNLMQGELGSLGPAPLRFFHFISGHIVVEERVVANPSIVRVYVFSGDGTAAARSLDRSGRTIALARESPSVVDLPGANVAQLRKDLPAILEGAH